MNGWMNEVGIHSSVILLEIAQRCTVTYLKNKRNHNDIYIIKGNASVMRTTYSWLVLFLWEYQIILQWLRNKTDTIYPKKVVCSITQFWFWQEMSILDIFPKDHMEYGTRNALYSL